MRNNRMARLATAPIMLGLVSAGPPPPRPVWDCGPPLAGWKTVRSDKENAVNTLVLGPANASMMRPAEATWNGAVVTPEEVREYTSLAAQFMPIPTLLLVLVYGTDCDVVSDYRRTIDHTLDCDMTGVCVEVSP